MDKNIIDKVVDRTINEKKIRLKGDIIDVSLREYYIRNGEDEKNLPPICDEFAKFYDENEDQSDIPYDEEEEDFFETHKDNLKYYTFIRNYKDWPTEIDAYARCFKERYGVYPNLLLANRQTYSRMEDAFNFFFAPSLKEDEKEYLRIKLGMAGGELLDEDDELMGWSNGRYFSMEEYRLLQMESTDFGSGVIEFMRVSGEYAEDPDFSDDCRVSVKDKTAIPFPVIDMEETGKNIKKIMKEENVSQTLLARIFNVSKQAISGWVNGKSLPNIDNLTVLSRILNRPLEAILITRDREK